MRNLFVCLLFVSTFSYSQNLNFNLTNYKTYKLVIGNLTNQEQATNIINNAEKSLLSEFAWVDFKTGIGYFINNKSMQISSITSLIKNSSGLTCSNTQEINLDNNLFLEIYSQRSGLIKESIKNKLPDYINLGDQKKSEFFYQTAKEIWIKNYPENYNSLNNNEEINKENIPEHYPVFINTGNFELDNSKFDNAKQEWIKNYPDEVEKMTQRSYQNSTGEKNPKIIK